MNTDKFKHMMEEPCSILLGKGNLDDKAYVAANAFIPNMRLNKWKPHNGYPNSNHEFCYIDMDKESIFKGNECSLNMLKKNPIIDAVWKDNNMENTRSVAFNKCIFSIVPSNATDSNINQFWNDIDKLNCTAIFSDAQKSNAILSSNIQFLNNHIKEQNSKNLYLNNALNSCNIEIETLNYQYFNLVDSNKRFTEENEEKNNKLAFSIGMIDELSKYSSTYQNNFLKTRAYLISDIEYYFNSFSVSNVLLDKYKNSNANLIESNTKFSLAIEEKKLALEATLNMITNLSSSNDNLYKLIKTSEAEYSACSSNLTQIQSNLKLCHLINDDYKKHITASNSILEKKYSESNIRFMSWSNCMHSNVFLEKDYDIARNDFLYSLSNLSNCLLKKRDLIVQSNILQSSITNWINTHKHCDDLDRARTALSKIDVAMKTCRIKDLSAHEQRKFDIKRLESESKNANFHACLDDQNTLFTSVPVPPIPQEMKTVLSETNEDSDYISKIVTCQTQNIYTDLFCPDYSIEKTMFKVPYTSPRARYHISAPGKIIFNTQTDKDGIDIVNKLGKEGTRFYIKDINNLDGSPFSSENNNTVFTSTGTNSLIETTAAGLAKDVMYTWFKFSPDIHLTEHKLAIFKEYIDPPPPSTSSEVIMKYCSQYIPDKKSIIDESSAPINLNGAKWGFYCKYKPGKDEDILQIEKDNAYISGQLKQFTMPPIFIPVVIGFGSGWIQELKVNLTKGGGTSYSPHAHFLIYNLDYLKKENRDTLTYPLYFSDQEGRLTFSTFKESGGALSYDGMNIDYKNAPRGVIAEMLGWNGGKITMAFKPLNLNSDSAYTCFPLTKPISKISLDYPYNTWTNVSCLDPSIISVPEGHSCIIFKSEISDVQSIIGALKTLVGPANFNYKKIKYQKKDCINYICPLNTICIFSKIIPKSGSTCLHTFDPTKLNTVVTLSTPLTGAFYVPYFCSLVWSSNPAISADKVKTYNAVRNVWSAPNLLDYGKYNLEFSSIHHYRGPGFYECKNVTSYIVRNLPVTPYYKIPENGIVPPPILKMDPNEPFPPVTKKSFNSYTYVPNVDHMHNDLAEFKTSDKDECADKCAIRNDCVGAVYAPSIQSCWLKKQFGPASKANDRNTWYKQLPGPGITVYLETNFGGKSVKLARGEYNMQNLISLGVPNDSVASIKVDQGCTAVIYEHVNYGGRSMIITKDTPSLGVFHKILSSIKVR